MEKFIPYEKLSKKEKRKLDSARRGTWGEVNPVTRKPANSKAYNRRKAQNWRKDLPNSVPCFYSSGFQICRSPQNRKQTAIPISHRAARKNIPAFFF
ncbi:MAG: hypothetical protein ACI3V0_12330 [Faecousia sp.]